MSTVTKVSTETVAASLVSGSIPTTMKAAISRGFGSIEDNVFVVTDWPVPTLAECDQYHLLIRVLACALAPGDVRVLKGSCDYAQLPKSGHPYVVGSDVSGVVVKSHNSKFQPGNYVVSRFEEPGPVGGVAEYRLVKTTLTEHCPSSIPSISSCGLPASSMAAKRIVREYVKSGDRVLVIGGSGGVGTSVIQYAKPLGRASFVATVSTQCDLCLQLGADRVIDYRTHNWWEDPTFCDASSSTSSSSEQLDVVIDLVDGHSNWSKGAVVGPGTAIRRGGTYVSLLTGVETDLEIHSCLDVTRVMAWVVGRMLWTRLNPRLPRWVVPAALKLEEGDLAELFQDVTDGKLQPVLDPSSPFDFTAEGVRMAFHLQQSIHAHGKVVIKIADE